MTRSIRRCKNIVTREAKLDVKGFLAAEQARIISIQTLRYILGREGSRGVAPHYRGQPTSGLVELETPSQ